MKKTIRTLQVAIAYVKFVILSPIVLTMLLIKEEAYKESFNCIMSVVKGYFHGFKAAHAANIYWIETGDVEGACKIRMIKLMEGS